MGKGIENDTKKLVLIDGNAIVHRAYHSIPKNFTNRAGEKTNAVYGFAMTLIKVLEDLKPEYLAASFDLAGPTFRHREYKEYKATRVKADQDLYDQIPRIKKLVERLGVPIYEKEGFEADDILGTITSKIQKTSNPPNGEAGKSQTNSKLQNTNYKNRPATDDPRLTTYIVSGDKDIFQLINQNVRVYNLRKGLSQTAIVDAKNIEEEYNLQPEDFIDLKALAGDASDNIPGVPGIGQKTATDLLQKFDTLEKLYETIEIYQEYVIARSETTKSSEGDPFGQSDTDNRLPRSARNDNLATIKPRILNLLIENKEQAFLSQKLATIRRDVPIDFKLEDCAWGEYDKGKLRELFEELGFQSLLRRYGNNKTEKPKNLSIDEQKNKDTKKQLKLL